MSTTFSGEMTAVWRVRFGWGATVVTAAVLAFWAGTVFAEPPSQQATRPVDVEYVVAEGEVGLSQNFMAQGQWPRSPATPVPATGTVTGVDLPEDGWIDVGAQIMSIDLRPMVAARGEVPAFRLLQRGTQGPDVAQLQALLRAEGFEAPDSGSFGVSTVTAVRAWQHRHGFPVDGIVRPGDVLFLPDLPRRLVVAEDVIPGSVVAAGQILLDVLAEEPLITVTLDSSHAGLVPQQGAVVVRAGEAQWNGVIADAVSDEAGSLVLTIRGDAGGPVCAEACATLVPMRGSRSLPVEIVVTPETSGPVVPASALRTGPDGTITVRLVDGAEVGVEVLASARGLAVVEGLTVGQRILVPAGAASS